MPVLLTSLAESAGGIVIAGLVAVGIWKAPEAAKSAKQLIGTVALAGGVYLVGRHLKAW